MIANSDDRIWVFDSSGNEVWNSGDIGDSVWSVEVGDLDKDGYKDDFVVGNDGGTDHDIRGFNTTDGTTWSLMWTISGTGNYVSTPYEVHVTDFNDSFDYNLVTWISWTLGQEVMVYSTNGTFLFTPGGDLGTIRSCCFIDLDKDGFEDELLTGEDGDLRAWDKDGNLLWTGDTASVTYEVISIDLDNDGFADESVVADRYDITAFDENGNELWEFTHEHQQRYY